MDDKNRGSPILGNPNMRYYGPVPWRPSWPIVDHFFQTKKKYITWGKLDICDRHNLFRKLHHGWFDDRAAPPPVLLRRQAAAPVRTGRQLASLFLKMSKAHTVCLSWIIDRGKAMVACLICRNLSKHSWRLAYLAYCEALNGHPDGIVARIWMMVWFFGRDPWTQFGRWENLRGFIWILR